MDAMTQRQVAEINDRLGGMLDLSFVVMTDTERPATVIVFDEMPGSFTGCRCEMDTCGEPSEWTLVVIGATNDGSDVKEFLCLGHSLEAMGAFKHLAGAVHWDDRIDSSMPIGTPPSASARSRRCEADARMGTGSGVCDSILDSHGNCPNADRHR